MSQNEPTPKIDGPKFMDLNNIYSSSFYLAIVVVYKIDEQHNPWAQNL